MRASSRRATHSGPRRARSVATLQGESLVLEGGQAATPPGPRAKVVASASSSTVVIPISSRWPRSARATASSSPSRAGLASRGALGGAPQVAPVRPMVSARPAAANSPNRARHSGRAGTAPVERQQVVQVVGGFGRRLDLVLHPRRWRRGRGCRSTQGRPPGPAAGGRRWSGGSGTPRRPGRRRAGR